jgi:cellobiose PTS system EIIC component
MKIMDKISAGLEKYLVPVMNKINQNKYLGAIRDALIATMSLTIIGSVFLLLAYPPFPQVYVDFLAEHPALVDILYFPWKITVGIISVYTAFGIGYYLSEAYGMNKVVNGCCSVYVFLLMAGGIDSGYLGAEGLFTAMVASIFSVKVAQFCENKNIGFKLPDTVPANISGGFEAFIPCTICSIIVLILTYGIGFDINQILANVFTPLITLAGNSLVTALLYVILATLMWFAGIHPQILATALTPAWTIMAAENMAAYAAGDPVTNIFTKSFFFCFVFIGGQCGTLMLNIAMLFSKSKTHRDLAKLALPAGIFNINEPMLFGLPIVLNSTMIIPALLGQIVTVFTTYFAFSSGMLSMINPDAAIWDMPSLIGGTLCTGSILGTVLVAVNMIIQFLIYLPFYKIVEKQMIEKEQELENN